MEADEGAAVEWIETRRQRGTGSPFSASDAVGSLLLTRWSSRISCISGERFLAGMNKTKPLREVTRTHLLRDVTHSGGTWKNCCNAWGGGRWTIGRRAFFQTLVQRDSSTHSFVDPGCWMRCKRENLHTVYSFHGRRTCTAEVASGRGIGHEKTAMCLAPRGVAAPPPNRQ